MQKRKIDELISHFNRKVADMDIDMEYKMELLGMITAILQRHDEDMKHAPTIERKTGKWEERKVSSEKVIDEWQSARCSVCGKYHTTPYMYYFDDFNYCPNCGADMRGET